jgi:hypothetical protein
METAMFVLIAVLALSSSSVEGSQGVKDYGDSCNLVSSAVQLFEALGDGKNQYQNACDVSKGLYCQISVCKCAIGEYKQNFFEQIVGGGRCSGAAKNASVGASIILSLIPLFYYFKY